MYASEQQTVGRVGTLNYQAGRIRAKPRHSQIEKSDRAGQHHTAFLKHSFSPIAAASVVRSSEVEGYNYITPSNYQYLLCCAHRYAELLATPYHHRMADTCGAGIVNVYHELEKLVGDDVNINLQINGERLEFVLWKQYQWGDWGLYYMPLEFVERLPTPLRRLTISFLHQFQKSTQIDTINQRDEVDMAIDWQCEIANDCEDDEKENILKNVQMYRQGGKIFKLMERIRKRNYHKDLPKALTEYVPESDFERSLIEIMQEGLKFIGENRPTIFQYAYDPYEDENYDENDDPVRLDQQFMFIYHFDNVIEGVIEMLNETLGNYGEISPCTTLVLSPDSGELLSLESYPEEFFAYMDKFINFIRNI